MVVFLMYPCIVDIRKQNSPYSVLVGGLSQFKLIHRFRCLESHYNLELRNAKFIYSQYHLQSIKVKLMVWTLQTLTFFLVKTYVNDKSINIA